VAQLPKLTPEQIVVATEVGSDGHRIGRDPRRMTQDELRAMGHEPMSPLKAIRLHCIDCSGGSISEVTKCMHLSCAKWLFRMGTNPWRAPRSEAQLEHSRTLGLKAAEKSAGASSLDGFEEESSGGGS
jgi:hypothetical protein